MWGALLAAGRAALRVLDAAERVARLGQALARRVRSLAPPDDEEPMPLTYQHVARQQAQIRSAARPFPPPPPVPRDLVPQEPEGVDRDAPTAPAVPARMPGKQRAN